MKIEKRIIQFVVDSMISLNAVSPVVWMAMICFSLVFVLYKFVVRLD